MDLLLPFNEYCELADALCKEQNKSRMSVSISKHMQNNITMLQTKAMFIVDPSQTAAIVNLVNQCNPEMIEELMDYFDKSAPIQELLEKRLKEIEKTNLKSIDTVVQQEDKSVYPVYDILIEEMNKKNIKTDADLYNYIDMDRRVFGKFRKKGANISRENALWLAVGFELSYPEAVEFLGKLGYAFKRSDDRERLIAQVMRTRKYNFREMQSILYSFGFKMFGEVKD